MKSASKKTILIASVASLLAGPSLHAITKGGAGSGTDLFQGTAWTGGIAPATGDAALWDATSLVGAQTVSSPVIWNKMTFTSMTGALNITGSQITLSGATSGSSFNVLDVTAGTQAVSIANDLLLTGAPSTTAVAVGNTSARIQLNGGGANLTLGKVTSNGGALANDANLWLRGTGSNIINGTVTVDGQLAKGDTGTWTLNGANSIGWVYSNNGTLLAGNNQAFGTGSVYVATGGGATVTIASKDSTARNLGNTLDMTLSGGTVTAALGQTSGGTGGLTFGALNVGTINAQIQTNVASSFTSVTGTTGGITKSGTGTLTLSGSNSYTGGTTVNAGYLVFNSGAVPTGVGMITANNSGALVVSGAQSSVSGWLSSGKIATTSTGTIAITGNSSENIDFTAGGFNSLGLSSTVNATYSGTITAGTGGYKFGGDAGTLTISSNLAQATSLTKVGAGTVVLSGTNSYNGATTVSGGTLTLGNATALGATTNTLTLQTGGIVDLGANVVTTGALTLTSGTIQNGTLTASSYTTTAGTINAVLAGSGTLTQNAAGTTILSGANTYTGGTTIAAGTLQINDVGSLSTGGITLGAGTLQYNRSSPTNVSDTLHLGGSSGDTLSLKSIGAGPITYLGNTAAVFSSTRTLALGGASTADNTFSGIISNSTGGGTLSVNKVDGGKWILSGANTYTGKTTIAGGTLSVSNIGTSGNTSALGTNSTIDYTASATLLYTGTGETTDKVLNYNSASAGGVFTNNGTGTVTFTNAFTSAATAGYGVTYNGTGNTSIVGISQTGTTQLINLNKTGIGQLTLTGFTDLKGGALSVGGGIVNLASTFTSNSTTTGSLTPMVISRNNSNGGVLKINGSASVFTTTTNNSGGILGGWATFNDSTWAVTNSGASAITGLTTFTSDWATATGNADITADNTSNGLTVNSLRFNNTGVITPPATLTQSLSGANVLTSGGILVTSAVGATNVVITGGTSLTAGASTDIIVHQNNTAGTLSINSVIVNNGTTGLTKSGAGTLVLAGMNTYTGGTFVNEGTLNLSNQLAVQSSTVTINPSASLVFDQSVGSNAFTLGALAGAGTLALQNNAGTPAAVALSVGGNNASTTYSGVISGAGSLTKAGTGTLTLSGNNTYTGGTALSAGAITLGNTSALGTGALTIMATGNSVLSTTPLTGALTIANTIALNNTGTTGFIMAGGIGNSVKLSGDIAGTTATLRLNETAGNANAIFTLSGNNTFTTTTEILMFSGSLRIGSATALGASTNTLHYNSYAGTLSFAGSYTIANNINFDFAAQNIDTEANNVTLSGIISGNQALTKIGTGTLTFSGTNTYTGDTAVSAGTLNLANSLALQNSTLASGGVIFDSTVTSHAFTLGGLKGSGNITLQDNATTPNAVALTVNQAGNTTFSGVSSGAGSLVKSGAGTLTLSGANTYTGGTTITSGTLSFANGALGTTGNISMNGGTLQWNGTNTQDVSSRIVMNTGKTATFDTNGNNVAFSSTIGNSTTGSLTKSGSGTLTLSGNNNYSGTTTINGGTLNITGTNSSGGNVTLNGSSTTPAILNLQNNNALGTSVVTSVNRNSGIQVQGGITLPATVTFVLSNDGVGSTVPYAIGNVSGDNRINGTILMTSGAGAPVIQSDSGSLTLAGNVTIATGQSSRSLILQGASTGANTVSGVVSDLSGTSIASIVKNGPGIWTVSGANTYTGGTTISAGTLSFANGSLGTTGNISMNGGTLQWNGTNTQDVSSRIVMNAGKAATFDTNGNNVTFASGIGGSTTGSLVKTGTGTLTLSALAGYSGTTTIKNGTLLLAGGADNRLPTSTTLILGDTSTSGKVVLGDASDYTNQTVAGLTSTGLGGSIVNGRVGDYAEFTVNIASGTNTFAGVIGGAGTDENNIVFHKNGAGTLVLSGANTYTNGTTIDGGSLNVTGSLTGTSVSVNSGGTFAGSGSVKTNNKAFTVASGAKLDPTNSAFAVNTGTANLDISGAAGANNGALVFNLDSVSSSDKITLTLDLLTPGALAIGSGVLDFADFAFTTSGGFGEGTYTLIDSNALINGTLGTNLTGTIAGLDATLSLGDNGNDVILTVVPEPGSAVALFGGMGVLLGMRRRSRKV